MTYILKEAKRHFRIYGFFAKMSLMKQLEYRANFIIGILTECAWLCTKLLYVFIVHRTDSQIGGLSPDQITLYVGTFIIFTAIYTGVFMNNIGSLPWRVRRGDLDLMLVKPISTQFHLTMREVEYATPIPNIIGGAITVAVSWSRLGLEAGLANIAAYICLILCGSALAYSLFLIPCLLTFWAVKINALVSITYSLWDFNSMPMNIYGKWLQRIGLFVIPIFVITNFPVMALFDNLTPVLAVWGIIAPIAVFALARVFWKLAIKRYSSAGG